MLFTGLKVVIYSFRYNYKLFIMSHRSFILLTFHEEYIYIIFFTNNYNFMSVTNYKYIKHYQQRLKSGNLATRRPACKQAKNFNHIMNYFYYLMINK